MAGVAGSILTFTFFCGAHESHKETHNDIMTFCYFFHGFISVILTGGGQVTNAWDV